MKKFLLSLFIILVSVANVAVSQQPQAPTGTPLSSTNAKYVQGVGTGYWPTAGSGFTLNIATGTSFCSNSIVTYAGGTLTMTASTVNYVYLNGSCIPASNTSGFATGDIPIATVTTNGSGITTNGIQDDRTEFFSGSGGGSSGVSTWNSRTGNVSLELSDITALGELSNSISGNAATASELENSPTLCPSDEFAQGILANGDATGCASGGGGSGGNQIPSNAVFVFTGTSAIDDDTYNTTGNLGAPITISSWSTTSNITTIVFPSAPGLTTGQWISTRGLVGWPGAPSQYGIVATGYSLFQVQSATGDNITINTPLISAGTCASSCGVVNNAMSYLPFITTSQPAFPSGSSNRTYAFLPNPINIEGLNAGFSAMFASSGTQITCPVSVPTYLIINSFSNDVISGESAANIESYYQGIFHQAHECGMTVVAMTAPGVVINQELGGDVYPNFFAVQSWLTAQGKTPANAGYSSEEYWDEIVDAGNLLNNALDTNVYDVPAGNQLIAQSAAATMANGGSSLLSVQDQWFGDVGEDCNTSCDNILYLANGIDNNGGAWIWGNYNATARVFMIGNGSAPQINANGLFTAAFDTEGTSGHVATFVELSGVGGTGRSVVDVVNNLTPNSTQSENENILTFTSGVANAYMGLDYESSSDGTENSFFVFNGGAYDNFHAITGGLVCVGVATVNQTTGQKGCPTDDMFSVGPTGAFTVDVNGNTTANNLDLTGSCTGCSDTVYGAYNPSTSGGYLTPTLIQGQATSGTSMTLTDSVTSGHVLAIMAYFYADGQTVTCTDSLSTSYTDLGHVGNGFNGAFDLIIGQASSSGSDTITCAYSGEAGGLIAAEFSNVTTTIDSAVRGAAASGGAPAMSVTSTAFNDLVLFPVFDGTVTLVSPLTSVGATLFGSAVQLAYAVQSNEGTSSYSITNSSAYGLATVGLTAVAGGSRPGSENQIFFDTSTTPYTQYVYHSGVWVLVGGGGSGSFPTPVTQNVTNVQEADFTSCITSGYKNYQITFTDVTVTAVSGSPHMGIQFSTNGGSSYDTSTNYNTGRSYVGIGSSGNGINTESNGAFLSLTGLQGDTAAVNALFDGTWTFINIGSSSTNKQGTFNMVDGTTASNTSTWLAGGFTYTNATPVNAFRLYLDTSGSTFSGSITCQPLAQ